MNNSNLNFNSVETLPNLNAKAAFQVDSSAVFREQGDIVPTIIDDRTAYMPWGGDNQMPFDILNLIESDETLSTCQIFNAEVCYGSGLEYRAESAEPRVKSEIEGELLYPDRVRSSIARHLGIELEGLPDLDHYTEGVDIGGSFL